jgi:formate dehydrogenase major subunit
VGCEIIAEVENETILRVEGDPNGVVSGGKLCVKGRYGFDFVSSPSRVRGARIRRSYIDRTRDRLPDDLRAKLFLLAPLDCDFFAAPLDIAVKIAAWQTAEILQGSGGEAFGFIGGARTSCENAYFFQKFAREFIGAANVDNCARVCHSPSLAGLRRTLGEGAASNPFADIFEAELLVIIGSNTTEAHPIVGGKIIEAARRGAKLAVIDTRKVTIGKFADIEMIAPPESNLAALNKIAKIIAERDLIDLGFVSERTNNFNEFRELILSDKSIKFSDFENYRDLDAKIENLANLIANNKTLFLWGLGVTEHTLGSDSVSAISNIALLTGNIGKIGAGVMPLRGQNNVQGACDMGALPNYDLGYKTPAKTGLKTPEMIDAILEGKIRAIFNMGEDIAHIHGDLAKVERALEKLEFLCVNELFMSSIAKRADIVIGVKSAYERSGVYINAERRANLTTPLIYTDAIEDYEFFALLQSEISGEKLEINNEKIWREVCEKASDRFGDLKYENLREKSAQWFGERLYVNNFHTDNKKANFFYAKTPDITLDSDQDIFTLSTGRVLTQYNNAAQTSETPRLNDKYEEDFALISPVDAARFDLAKRYFLASDYGKSAALRLKIDDGIKPRTLFCTFHHARSRVNRLFGGESDQITMTPRFKALKVKIVRE